MTTDDTPTPIDEPFAQRRVQAEADDDPDPDPLRPPYPPCPVCGAPANEVDFPPTARVSCSNNACWVSRQALRVSEWEFRNTPCVRPEPKMFISSVQVESAPEPERATCAAATISLGEWPAGPPRDGRLRRWRRTVGPGRDETVVEDVDTDCEAQLAEVQRDCEEERVRRTQHLERKIQAQRGELSRLRERLRAQPNKPSAPAAAAPGFQAGGPVGVDPIIATTPSEPATCAERFDNVANFGGFPPAPAPAPAHASPADEGLHLWHELAAWRELQAPLEQLLIGHTELTTARPRIGRTAREFLTWREWITAGQLLRATALHRGSSVAPPPPVAKVDALAPPPLDAGA